MSTLRRASLPATIFLLLGLSAVARILSAGDESPPSGPPPAPRDTGTVHAALLVAMDRDIARRAAEAHLDARLTLDRVLPVPYVGIDADPFEGGMKVTEVYPLTGAEEVGLRAGDVIVSVAGLRTPDAASLGSAIRRHAVGDRLAVEVRRAAGVETLSVRLGKRPEEDEDLEEQFPAAFPAPSRSTERFLASFDRAEASAAFDSVLGGHGADPDWRVVVEGDASFLRQAKADPTGIRYPMALAGSVRSPDATVRVRFRLTEGRQDRAAGVVLRYEDPWNYLVARVNAVESDLRIFRVAYGLRRTLPGAKVKVDVRPGAWHVLEFRAEGPRLVARVDDGAEAVSYDTFLRGDRVGLWTKSDSVSDFDDFECVPSPAPVSGDGR